MPRGVKIILAVGISLLLVAAIYEVAGEWSELNIARSKACGDKVIEALNAYKKDQRRYPDNLEQLVPKYLPMVPEPTAGTRRWRYETDGTGFILLFEGWHFRTCEYGQDVGWWRNDDF